MRALVVSDVRFYRESVARALADDGIAAAAVESTAASLPAAAAQASVALVDIDAGGLARTMAGIGGACPVVGLAMTPRPPIAAAAALGIRAFVGCDESLAVLVRTVRLAVEGEAVCPSSIAALLFASLGRETTPAPPPVTALTRRELEIGRLITRGLSNSEIASELFIQTTTVKNHVHQILRKLDLQRRGQLASSLRDA
ncbi:helix-turn-helix transcriptional regulator [Microbacterium terricola]|uniref:DNA-binding response regulator n=1 Tax=Microbacterium terricola TaxID=344163 RepID=A0ABM8E0U0_9MICO|nr:response regulator transcription factor [Microbacterium terricola]UYK40705.1 response regulator transcription factor [Microbacterium terricola]BDV31558.1 DNA-binding response regulator [Microbacterium terricola]